MWKSAAAAAATGTKTSALSKSHGASRTARGHEERRPRCALHKNGRRAGAGHDAAATGETKSVDAACCFVVGDNASGNITHHLARRYAQDPSAFANGNHAGLIAIHPFYASEERTPAEPRLVGAPPSARRQRCGSDPGR